MANWAVSPRPTLKNLNKYSPKNFISNTVLKLSFEWSPCFSVKSNFSKLRSKNETVLKKNSGPRRQERRSREGKKSKGHPTVALRTRGGLKCLWARVGTMVKAGSSAGLHTVGGTLKNELVEPRGPQFLSRGDFILQPPLASKCQYCPILIPA